MVEVQDFGIITDPFRGMCGIYPNSSKKHHKMSTCNWLDLETLGSQPIMPQNPPVEYSGSWYCTLSLWGQYLIHWHNITLPFPEKY